HTAHSRPSFNTLLHSLLFQRALRSVIIVIQAYPAYMSEKQRGKRQQVAKEEDEKSLKNKNRIKGSFGCRFVCLLQSRRLNSVAETLRYSTIQILRYKDTNGPVGSR
ncbi:hypothetical protein M5D96_001238, partial [Drosophila gunungcola]